VVLTTLCVLFRPAGAAGHGREVCDEDDGHVGVAEIEIASTRSGNNNMLFVVPLQGTDMKFAMKTLDKWEMQGHVESAPTLSEYNIMRHIIPLQVTNIKFAMKTLDKWEMQERMLTPVAACRFPRCRALT
jgi:hypothetical protein